MVPKIADFGLSRCFDAEQTRTITSKLIGSQGYLAPEFYNGVLTMKTDIYSIGVIIMEILTGQKGYHEIESVLESWRVRFKTSQGDTRLDPVRVCAEIGIECTDSNPAKRPDIQRIIERLDEMESKCGFTKTDLFTSSATNPESSGCDDKVKLEVMGRTKSIPSTMRVKEFPVLVRVTGPLGYIKSSRAGLDLVAVLGTSESMMLENRLDSMKQAMMFVIDDLGPDDRLSVVSFNETTQCLTEPRLEKPTVTARLPRLPD
ncbi:hypothetical protein EJB05_29372, partial [Eragrostis curvula]